MGTHPIFESDFDCLTEKKNMGKRRRKAQRPPPQPILAEKGPINFEYGGDRTQQSKDAFKRQESERLAASSDCFIDPAAEMEDEIEIKELPHKDFGKSGKEWGTQAQKMMEKMGWKRGLGLGPRNQGVVNPVIPSGKYDGAGKRRGLGSLETAPDQKAKKAKSGDILQLPSYLRKRKKSPSLDPFIVGEILTKYKMSKSDLAIGKQSDHQYGYLNKKRVRSMNKSSACANWAENGSKQLQTCCKSEFTSTRKQEKKRLGLICICTSKRRVVFGVSSHQKAPFRRSMSTRLSSTRSRQSWLNQVVQKVVQKPVQKARPRP